MWTYQGKPFITNSDNHFGFVYMITNVITGKRYIGQKTLHSTKTKVVKGKKKKVVSESNWINYYSSSTELQSDVTLYGKNSFSREILCFCSTKNQLNYMEAKYQFLYGVLENDGWYNKWISIKCGPSGLNDKKEVET